MKKAPYTSDTVKGSSPEFPYAEQRITISGTEVLAGERLLARYSELSRQLAEEIEAAEAYIEGLNDPDLRTILRMRYVQGKTVDEIAETVHYSRRTVYNKLNSI